MTIGTTLSSITIEGNGSTTVFSYPFIINSAADADVTYVDPAGAASVLTPLEYAITGIGDPLGGDVIYPISGPPIPAGSTLTIARINPLVQTTSVSAQGPTFAAIEAALDYLTENDQQLQTEITRNLAGPITDPAGLNYTLPAVAQRANTGLAFDGSGNVIAGATPQVTVSGAMIPVVEASTIADALADLGGASLTADNSFTGTQALSGTLAMSAAAIDEAMATIASASTTDIGAAAANYIKITGTTTITAFDTIQAGTERTLEFAGVLTLTNSSAIILPGGANITTAAGDTAVFRSEGSGNWRCISYQAAAGVTPGTYDAADVTVNAAGRITAISAGTVSPFSAKFTSSNQTITLSSTLTISHTLGAQPFGFSAVLVNVTAEGGWTPGQEVAYYSGYAESAGGATLGITVGADADNIYVVLPNTDIAIFNLSTYENFTITPSKWAIIARAWY